MPENAVDFLGKKQSKPDGIDKETLDKLYSAAKGEADLVGFLDDIALFWEENKKDWHKKNLDEYGLNVIWWAARLGNIDFLKILCDKYPGEIDFDLANKDAPLIAAAKNKKFDMVKFLIEQDQDWKSRLDKDGYSLVFFLVILEELEMLEYLEKKDSEILNATNDRGANLAMIAAGHGKLESVKFLISRNEEWHLDADDHGAYLAHHAIYSENVDLLEYLHQKNPEIFKYKQRHGLTPLNLAVRANKKISRDFLINKFSNPESENYWKIQFFQSHYGLFDWAVTNNNSVILEYLLALSPEDLRLKYREAASDEIMPTSALERLSLKVSSLKFGFQHHLGAFYKKAVERCFGLKENDGRLFTIFNLYLTRAIISLNYSDKTYHLAGSVSLLKCQKLISVAARTELTELESRVLNHIINLEDGGAYNKSGSVVKIIISKIVGHKSYFVAHCDKKDLVNKITYLDGNRVFNDQALAIADFKIAAKNRKSFADIERELLTLTSNESIQLKLPEITKTSPTFRGDIKKQKRGNCTAKSVNILFREILIFEGYSESDSKEIYKNFRKKFIESCANFAKATLEGNKDNPKICELAQDVCDIYETHKSRKEEIAAAEAQSHLASPAAALSSAGAATSLAASGRPAKRSRT